MTNNASSLMTKPRQTVVAAFSICLALVMSTAGPCRGEMNSRLESTYLSSEYDWAVFVEVNSVEHYLNYTGSKMHPLTRVRLYYRQFKGLDPALSRAENAKVYEDIWYYGSTPIGSRRMFVPGVYGGSNGVIVFGNVSAGKEHPSAATDAALRTVVDFMIKKAVTVCALVPGDDYELISSALSGYGFNMRQPSSYGKQMSITLRSLNDRRDEQLFLHH